MTFEDQMETQGVKRIKDYVTYHQWQCKKKVAFPTEAIALMHTSRLKHKYRIYQCSCGSFHLTRRDV